ncbi:MAG TPA: hypothetical protein VL475_09730 [Planctomycetaceae bacterium]|nr:hypothetical protein [Planctomycetaceae bacterium]
MRTSVTILGGAALLTLGYVLGASQMLSPSAALAQGDAAKAAASGVEVSEETKIKIKAAATALKAAMDALVDEGKYTAATKGVNSFAVLTGGVHAIRDLERNAVVDLETYAALYANLATDSVAAELGRDENGNLTYKNKVIRIYPVSAIRGKYAIRADITGEELLPTASDNAAGKSGSPDAKP